MMDTYESPQKNRDGTNVSVLGLGEFGRNTIYSYSFELDAMRNCNCIGDFNLYVENYSHQETSAPLYRVENYIYNVVYNAYIDEVFSSADVLYIVVDINNNVDFQNSIRYAKFQKEYSKVQGNSVCISCATCKDEKIEELRKVFDYIIFTDIDAITKCRPIQLLIDILTRHICELEMADVSYIAEQAPIMHYFHYSIEPDKNFSTIIDNINRDLLSAHIEASKSVIISYFSFNLGDDYFESIIPLLSYFNNCIYQIGINKEMKNIEISIVCGQTTITEQ